MFNNLDTNDVVVFLSIGLIGLTVFLWAIFYARRPEGTDTDLTDGAVLMVENGTVTEASPVAIAMFGDCRYSPARDVLSSFLAAPEDACDRVEALEINGEQIDLVVEAKNGLPFHLIGEPAGAMIRLTLREASYLIARLSEAEARLQKAEVAATERGWERDTLMALVGNAPIIAWNRTSDGLVNWSGGTIQTRSGTIEAGRAVELVVARSMHHQRRPLLVGQPQKSRVEVVMPEGTETVSLNVIEITGPDNTRLGFATDASMTASAERTLTRFVQTMTETFAHLTVGLAIFDRNQTLALFNPALVQMWQVEPSWLAGRPSLRVIIDELRATRRLPDMQDFHKWRSRILSLFENTEAAAYEELWHLSDGSNIRVLARPHPHGSLAFIFDDVTERMRLEQRYRHSIDLRRATLDRLNEGIAVFGANGILQFVNQAFHEIWDTDAESIYPAMHARQLVGLCEDLTVETEVWRRLHSFITGDERRRAWTARLTMGSGRTLTVRVAPLPDGSTMTVFADITDAERNAIALHERNQALEAAEAMRAEVLDQLSYKLRTPLNSIMGFGQLLTDQRFDNSTENRQEYAANIVTAANELQETIQSVTELASLELDQIEPDAAELNIPATLREVRNLLDKRAAETGVKLTVSTEMPPILVHCNAARVRQIVFNLIADAIQRCQDGGVIELSAHWEDAQHFAISSFERPSQPLAAEGRNGSVNSLTLDLIRRLVNREGGSLDLRENAEFREVRITCVLPSDGSPAVDSDAGADKETPGGEQGSDGSDQGDSGLPTNVHSLTTPTGT